MYRRGQMMEVIVVTGGIGSGKSAVCRLLRDKYACGVYCADDRVKELYDECPWLVESMELKLGITLRDSDGRFVPSRLAEVIFSDRNALEMVESLVFPVLLDDFSRWCMDYEKDPFVIFESATVMEKTQLKSFGDKRIVVDAPFEVRLERACIRDHVSRERIYARMMNQPLMNSISEGLIVPEADAVILNDGSYEELAAKVEKIMNDLLNN